MIKIIIYGIDQFIVERLSEDMSKDLANLCEVQEDDITFIAPSSMVFHKGMEQTSWNIYVEVVLPKKIEVLQESIGKYISGCLKDVSIHQTIVFNYYLQDHRMVFENSDYPKFITPKNVVSAEDNSDSDEEVFEGDIFKDFGKK